MLNRDLLPTAETLNSWHYGVAPADDPQDILMDNLNLAEAIMTVKKNQLHDGAQDIELVVIDLLTGKLVEA